MGTRYQGQRRVVGHFGRVVARGGVVGAATLALLLAVACGAEPVRPVAPKDDWSSTPLTPEWTFLARGVSGDRGKECAAVDQALGRERTCVGSLCDQAVPLANEWLLRCRKVAPARVDAVQQLARTFEERTGEAPTECGRRATSILRDECSIPEACRPLVERWAASCAGTEGTPLVMRKLERAVVLAEGKEGFALDPRSCGDLFGDVVRGARCESKRQCEEALPLVEAFSARCMVAGDPVSWPTALSMVSVLSGTGRRVSPMRLSNAEAERGPEGPLALGERQGALLRLCGEPVTSGKQVVEARRDCKGGDFVLARVFEEAQGPTLRVGVLLFDEDRAFDARFPSLHVVAEADARIESSIGEVEKELDQAAQLARSGANLEAWRALARSLRRHEGLLGHPRFVEALARRDDVLAPALRELGKTKIATARRAKSAELAAFAQRSVARVLADVADGGDVEIGARGGAHLEIAAAMPRAVAAYRDAVADMARVLSVRNVRPIDAAASEPAARAEIMRCGAASKEAERAEEQVLRCAFGLEVCDADRLATRTRDLDRAREAKRVLVASADALVASSPASSAESLAAAQRAARCLRD